MNSILRMTCEPKSNGSVGGFSFFNSFNALLITFSLLLPVLLSAFESNLYIEIALVVLFLLVLFFTRIKGAILFYTYIVFFSHLTRSTGITIIAFLGLFLSVLILLRNRSILIKYVFPILLFAFYSVASIFTSSGFAGLVLVYSLVISLFIRERVLKNDLVFVKEFFFSIYLAAVVSILCGFIGYFGLASRFAIPIGVDSACMLLVGGMIFPFFFVKRFYNKIMLIIPLLITLFLTVSITGLVCLFVFLISMVLYYFFSKKISIYKKAMVTLLVIGFSLTIIYVWNYGTGLDFVDNLVERSKTVFSQINNGDYNTATTGRFDIYKMYLDYFNGFSTPQKLFGGWRLSYYGIAYYRNYSHSTPIDLLMFFGIIPSIVLLFLLIYSIASIKNSRTRFTFFLLKLAFATTSLSVSLLSGGYWLLIMLI